MNFTALVEAIEQAHEFSAAALSRAINISLTLRNWIIGAYIYHYELHEADRAEYGDRLLTRLAERLGNEKMTRTQERELHRYRAFYLDYLQIRESLSTETRCRACGKSSTAAAPTPATFLKGRPAR